ncbi:MAG: transcriptional repressor [Actinomycetota bacterium]
MTTSDDLDHLHAAAIERLTAHGHRYTRARRRIVTLLDEASAPVTIPQLLDIDGDLAQSSTYRNVAILEEAGVATRILVADDHARYELDERVTKRHHHHLICVECGEVQDFELSMELERSLDEALERAGRSATFRVERHRLDALGSCESCD